MRERNAALEDDIVRTPDDLAPRAVYADWLQSRGDPFGDIIALCLAKKFQEARRLIARHEDDLFGDLTRKMFAWDRGLIDYASFDNIRPKVMRTSFARMLEQRTCFFVRDIRLPYGNDPQLIALIGTVRALRSLRIPLLDVTVHLSSPTLEILHLCDHWQIGSFALLLRGTPFPTLHTLLIDHILDANLIDELVASPMFPNFRCLSLAPSDRRAAARLLDHHDAFNHVARLEFREHFGETHVRELGLQSAFARQVTAFRGTPPPVISVATICGSLTTTCPSAPCTTSTAPRCVRSRASSSAARATPRCSAAATWSRTAS